MLKTWLSHRPCLDDGGGVPLHFVHDEEFVVRCDDGSCVLRSGW